MDRQRLNDDWNDLQRRIHAHDAKAAKPNGSKDGHLILPPQTGSGSGPSFQSMPKPPVPPNGTNVFPSMAK